MRHNYKIAEQNLSNIIQFEQSSWTFNKRCKDAPIPPFKIELRNYTRADVYLRWFVADLILKKIDSMNIQFDAVAEIPKSMSFVVSRISDLIEKPAISLDYKEKKIIGGFVPGMRLIVVEDVTSLGDSKNGAAILAKKYGLEIICFLSFIDYELGVSSKIQEKFGIKCEHVYTIWEFLEKYKEAFTKTQVELISDYLKSIKKPEYLFT